MKHNVTTNPALEGKWKVEADQNLSRAQKDNEDPNAASFNVTTDELPPEVGSSPDGDKTVVDKSSSNEESTEDPPTNDLMKGKIHFTQFGVPYVDKEDPDLYADNAVQVATNGTPEQDEENR